ncbi:Zinc/iron permease, partial [Basidiobolus meristosporus CBS 931.73]
SSFGFLFSEDPMTSSFLATTYISLVPNLILFFVPPNIRTSSLNILVSFAVGGLLGDVFLHLLPQVFLGEHGEVIELGDGKMKWRNLYVGLGIFGGFLFFFLMDKFMRVASGGGHSHSHHNHGHGENQGLSTSVKTDAQIRQRKKTDTSEPDNRKITQYTVNQNVNLSAYLNLLADMTHNFTDGLAIAASFYTSPAIGISTFAAVFFHEIPHEVGDYAILIQSGFSKSRALGAQFVTAIGAFLGTAVGVAIEEATRNPELIPFLSGYLGGESNSIISASEMIIPATTGGFIYIATVGVIPELLEDSEQATTCEKLKNAFWQIVAMFVGVGLMVGI